VNAVHKANEDRKGCKVYKGRKDNKACKGCKVYKGRKDYKACKANKVNAVPRVSKACKVNAVPRVNEACKAFRVNAVPRVNEACKASRVNAVPRVNEACKANAVPRVNEACKAFRVNAVPRVNEDYKAILLGESLHRPISWTDIVVILWRFEDSNAARAARAQGPIAMGAIQRRVQRLESAAGSGAYSHEEALRELDRRDDERRAFCARASEAELIAKLQAIDAEEAEDIAELANPPPPPPEGTAWRWFHDLRYSQSPEDVREFQDECRRPPYVVALADRGQITMLMPPGASHDAEGWRLEWAKGMIAEARAQLAEGAPIADAIVAALRKRAGS
jgi:hypothetical protein